MDLFWLGVALGCMGTMSIELIIAIIAAVDIRKSENKSKEDNKDEER